MACEDIRVTLAYELKIAYDTQSVHRNLRIKWSHFLFLDRLRNLNLNVGDNLFSIQVT